MLARLLLVLCLCTPALAQTRAQQVVKRLYTVHNRLDRLDKTLAETRACFTPGFLKIIDKAMACSPNKGGAWVDVDFLVNSQGGWGAFEVGQAESQGAITLVHLKLWTGLRSDSIRKDPSKRKNFKPVDAIIHLTDLGQGPQISDIEFEPYSYKIGTKTETIARIFMRAYLDRIPKYKREP